MKSIPPPPRRRKQSHSKGLVGRKAGKKSRLKEISQCNAPRQKAQRPRERRSRRQRRRAQEKRDAAPQCRWRVESQRRRVASRSRVLRSISASQSHPPQEIRPPSSPGCDIPPPKNPTTIPIPAPGSAGGSATMPLNVAPRSSPRRSPGRQRRRQKPRIALEYGNGPAPQTAPTDRPHARQRLAGEQFRRHRV